MSVIQAEAFDFQSNKILSSETAEKFAEYFESVYSNEKSKYDIHRL